MRFVVDKTTEDDPKDTPVWKFRCGVDEWDKPAMERYRPDKTIDRADLFRGWLGTVRLRHLEQAHNGHLLPVTLVQAYRQT